MYFIYYYYYFYYYFKISFLVDVKFGFLLSHIIFKIFVRGVFVPSGSQHRNERISAIAEELSKGEYDIAILQEVWLLIVLYISFKLFNFCIIFSSTSSSRTVLHINLVDMQFLSASLYFCKRGAYWDRLCRDVVGWLSRACTVAKRYILGL